MQVIESSGQLGHLMATVEDVFNLKFGTQSRLDVTDKAAQTLEVPTTARTFQVLRPGVVLSVCEYLLLCS